MEGLLMRQAKLIGLELPKTSSKLPFGAVYAVGDNPASDIAGARAAGTFLIRVCLPTFLEGMKDDNGKSSTVVAQRLWHYFLTSMHCWHVVHLFSAAKLRQRCVLTGRLAFAMVLMPIRCCS